MKAIKLAMAAALAAAAMGGCGSGSGGGGSDNDNDNAGVAPDASAAVPEDVSLSWPAMYGYLLAVLDSAPDQQEPASLPGPSGPTSDVVEAETKP